jgi:hypothetical protein
MANDMAVAMRATQLAMKRRGLFTAGVTIMQTRRAFNSHDPGSVRLTVHREFREFREVSHLHFSLISPISL